MLLPAPFYLLSPGIVPFFCLVTALLMVYVLNGIRYSAESSLPFKKARGDRPCQYMFSILYNTETVLETVLLNYAPIYVIRAETHVSVQEVRCHCGISF